MDWRRPHLLIARRPCCVCLGTLVVIFTILAIFAAGIVQGTFEFGISFDEDQMSIRGDEVADRELAVEAGLQSSSSLSPTQLLLQRGRRQRALSADIGWSFHSIGIMSLHLRRAQSPASGAGSLLDDDALWRFALLQDELLRDPDLQVICNRNVRTGAANATYPQNGQCSGWLGVSYALRLPVARRSRYTSVRLTLPPGVPRAVVASALSAATVGGSINATALGEALAQVTDVSVSGGGLGGLGRLGGGGGGMDGLCTNGTIEAGDGVSNGESIALAGCGPPLDCCGCNGRGSGGSGGSFCAALPLCIVEGDDLLYRAAGGIPPPAMAVNTTTFIAANQAVRCTLSREIACAAGSPLRAQVGWSTALDYRNGSEGELLRVRARLEVGGWRRAGESYSDYRKRGRVRAIAAFRAAHRTVLRRTSAFSEAHADLDASFWASDSSSLSLTTALSDALLNAATWAAAGIAVGWLYMVVHLRSPLLATAGLIGVFLSFPLSCFVYTMVLDLGLLGIFNCMGLL